MENRALSACFACDAMVRACVDACACVDECAMRAMRTMRAMRVDEWRGDECARKLRRTRRRPLVGGHAVRVKMTSDFHTRGGVVVR